MNKDLYQDSIQIIQAGIQAVLPDRAVEAALSRLPEIHGRLVLVAAGKAAWQMASAACRALEGRIHEGIVITKYGHVKGALPGVQCFEAGHPVPDENGFAATDKALSMVRDLSEKDLVLFLLSGGGSALFERPLIPGEELQHITNALLASGAGITEINTLRKHLSAVKGGRFAQMAAPARIFAVVLSDVVGDPLDVIASGPAYPDPTTGEDALMIAKKYGLSLSDRSKMCLLQETPKELSNVQNFVTGSVTALCKATAEACRSLGYAPVILTERMECEARFAGESLGKMAAALAARMEPGFGRIALLAGGETVVRLTGSGLGGRNQELALAAAPYLAGLPNVALFSVGSDGTDGPTDAAGGYADGDTLSALQAKGISVPQVLADNDAYHALKAVGGLLITGPTGTNVNDVAVALITSPHS